MASSLPRSLEFAHRLVTEVLRADDLAVDATCGNGHDTVFLAQCVGGNGRVYAIDIQPQAIAETRRRVEQAGLQERVCLIQANHAEMETHLADETGRARVIVFNLGYLPGSDKQCLTQAATTLPAMAAALRILSPAGLMTVVVYEGHPGGEAEGNAVRDFLAALPQDQFEVARYGFLNQRHAPPYLLATWKKAA